MKIFASDFDNTLHFHDEFGGYFKKEDLEAVQQFQKEGNLFGLCTGRPLYGFHGDLDGGPDLDFIVASTGACIAVKKEDNYESIMNDEISADDVFAIYKQFDGRADLYTHADGDVYTIHHRRPEYDCQIVIQSKADLEDKHITGISMCTPSLEDAAVITAEINRDYKGKVSAYQNVNWLDVILEGTSKGTGARKAKELFHGDMIAGIGDSFNDVPLLEGADVSFTFHRAPEELQKKADYIVDTVAEAIEIFKKL